MKAAPYPSVRVESPPDWILDDPVAAAYKGEVYCRKNNLRLTVTRFQSTRRRELAMFGESFWRAEVEQVRNGPWGEAAKTAMWDDAPDRNVAIAQVCNRWRQYFGAQDDTELLD